MLLVILQSPRINVLKEIQT